MTQIPDELNFIQVEETAAYAPVAESTLYKVGGSMNYLLNRYPVPPGTIHMFGGLEANIPPGYLPADGRAESRTTYANLFSAVGTLWGIGDGLTTFNMPDGRGIWFRGVDTTSAGTAGRDPDTSSRTPTGTGTAAQPGSYQADDLVAHNHNLLINNGGSGSALQTTGQSFTASTAYIQATGGNETRPKNSYVLFIVKT